MTLSEKLKLVSVFVFITLSTTVQAQFPAELWHEGKVVLLNNDTIKGSVKYDLDRDIIQVNDREKIEAYTARKVLYFSIFDITSNQYRQFYALPYNVTADYKTPVFFEVFYEGRFSLLAREYITIQTTSYGPAGMSGSTYSRQVLAYNYYFLNDRGSINQYRKNKRELYLKMRKYEGEIKTFVKRNRLRIDNKRDLIQIFEYYNSLLNKSN